MSDLNPREYKGTMYDTTNPARMGPGMWHMIHWIANRAKTKEEIEYACSLLENICDAMKCGQCNGHCNEHVNNTDPPRNYINRQDGLLLWSVNFRNGVQKRLGRNNFYDVQIIKKLLEDDTIYVCKEDCEESSKTITRIYPGTGVRILPRNVVSAVRK